MKEKKTPLFYNESVLRTATPGAVSCLGDVAPLEGIKEGYSCGQPIYNLSHNLKYALIAAEKSPVRISYCVASQQTALTWIIGMEKVQLRHDQASVELTESKLRLLGADVRMQ